MLETNRLKLRPFVQSDLDFLCQLHLNPEVAKTTIDGIQTIEIVQKHLHDFIAHQEKFGYSQWAVFEKKSKEFVGRAGLTKRALTQEIGEQAEIRFALLPEFWGQGYASELTQALIKFAFEELDLQILAASYGVKNAKSARILTKNGFKFIKNIVPEGYGAKDEISYCLINRKF